jgi:hypothetical protein
MRSHTAPCPVRGFNRHENQPEPSRLQFKVALKEIEPSIWRRLQAAARYSFWDLYVALQDAMGWLDYHLHNWLRVFPIGLTPYNILR